MIQQYLGIPSDYIIIGLAAVAVVLLILIIVNMVQMRKMRARLEVFMKGKNAKSLEDTLVYRLEQVDSLRTANDANEKNIANIQDHLKGCYNKFGLEKYNALDEMGGNLSFALCMLDDLNHGYVLNVVHSRDGCYTYVKEIIDGNAVLGLAAEEETALGKAMGKLV